MTPRNPLRSRPFTKVSCPACGARILIDPSGRGDAIQCPRCLNAFAASAARSEPALAPAAAAAPAAAPPVEEPARAPGLAEGGPNDAEAARAALLNKLREAEAALADAGRVIAQFQEVENRLIAMGAAYVRAIERVRELEAALARPFPGHTLPGARFAPANPPGGPVTTPARVADSARPPAQSSGALRDPG